ncbi:hypothetical protein MKX03_009681, partial [Papaver bracteatum]
ITSVAGCLVEYRSYLHTDKYSVHHEDCQGSMDRVSQSSAVEIQFQLSAFKTFFNLAAFDAACFPLTIFSSSFDPGWASGISETAIQGLLGMSVEGGTDNVNQCFLEASHYGSTELVRILLQIAQRNNLDGNAVAFLGPLMRVAERGCMQVVQWFVQRGCRDINLFLALTDATSSRQVGIVAYLLPHFPQHVLVALSIQILKAAGERSGGSLDGVVFLLRSDFLGDSDATYDGADSIAKSDDESVAPELRAFLRKHWSEAVFLEGLRREQDHYVNVMRILGRGGSPVSLCLQDLPAPLIMAITCLPPYMECVENGGRLLSHRLRG